MRTRERARANDPPMTAREDSDARPLPSPTWCYRCGYNLAGLRPEGVCPECGLEVAASWPVWDLTRCHRAYRDQVRAELWWIGWSAVLAGIVVLGFAVSGCIALLAPSASWSDDAHVKVLAIAALMGLGFTFPLAMFERRWRRHPQPGKAMSAGPRRCYLMGLCLVAAGLCFLIFPAAVLSLYSMFFATVVWIMGAIIVVLGCGAVYVAALRYPRLVLVRTGRPPPPHWHDWLWTAAPLLGLAGMVLEATEVLPLGWGSVVFLAPFASAIAVAWRCMRAMARLKKAP